MQHMNIIYTSPRLHVNVQSLNKFRNDTCSQNADASNTIECGMGIWPLDIYGPNMEAFFFGTGA